MTLLDVFIENISLTEDNKVSVTFKRIEEVERKKSNFSDIFRRGEDTTPNLSEALEFKINFTPGEFHQSPFQIGQKVRLDIPLEINDIKILDEKIKA